MLWWFLILALSGGAVLWAGISAYLRVRRQMKTQAAGVKKNKVEQEADSL